MKRALNFQADRIELVLASHKVPARVTGGTVTPRLVRFQLALPLGTKLRQVARLDEELALSLGATSCRVFRHHDHLQLEFPRSDAQPVLLLDLCRRLACHAPISRPSSTSPLPPVTAVLGLDHDGVPLLLRLPSPDVAHVLIAGTTGSGKTALARSIIASLALFNSQRALQLLLIDPKRRGLLPLTGLPHLLSPLISSTQEALHALHLLSSEMERRDLEQRSDPRIVLVLDELADLLLTGGKPLVAAIQRLTQRGREAGIHLIACTQKPAAALIGGLVKSNFPVRLVGSVPSPEDAKVASGIAATGAERLLGQGDFLVVAKGQVTRMQAAYASAADLQRIVAGLRHGAHRQLLAPTGSHDAGSSRSPAPQPCPRPRSALASWLRRGT